MSSLSGVYSNRQRGGGRGSSDKSGGRLLVKKDSSKISVAARRAVVSAPVPVPVNTPSLRSQASVQGGEAQRYTNFIRPAGSRRPAGWSATDTSSLAPARGDTRFTKHFPDLGEVELQKQKDEEEEALARANAANATRASSSSQPSFTVTSLRSQSGGRHVSAPLRPGGRVSSMRMKGKDGSGVIEPSSVSGGSSGTMGGDVVGSKDPRRSRRGTGLLNGLDGGASGGGNARRGMADQNRRGKGGDDLAKNSGEEEWMQMGPALGLEISEDGKGGKKNPQGPNHVGVSGGSEPEAAAGKQGAPSPGLADQASSQATVLPSVPVRSTRDPYYPGKSWVGRKEEERDTHQPQQDQFETEATPAEAEIGACEREGLESIEPVNMEQPESDSAPEGSQPQMMEDEKELQIFREGDKASPVATVEERYGEEIHGSFGNEATTMPPMGITEAAPEPEPEPAWDSDLVPLNYIQTERGNYGPSADPYMQSGSRSYNVATDTVIMGPRKVDWGGGATSQLLQNPVDGGTVHHRLNTPNMQPKTFDRAVVPPPRVSSASPPISKQVKRESSWMNLKGSPTQLAAHPTAISRTRRPGMADGNHRIFNSLDMSMSSHHPWGTDGHHPISDNVLQSFHHSSSSEEDLVQIFNQLGTGNEETGSGGNGTQVPRFSSARVFSEGGGVNLLTTPDDIMHGSTVTHRHEIFSLAHPTATPSPSVGHFTNTLPITSTTPSMNSKYNKEGGGGGGSGSSNLHVNPTY